MLGLQLPGIWETSVIQAESRPKRRNVDAICRGGNYLFCFIVIAFLLAMADEKV